MILWELIQQVALHKCVRDNGGTVTWCVVCCRYRTEPSGYRQTQNATNRLVFVPRLDDDNTTLYCVATKDSRRVLVAVSLNVTGGPWRHRNDEHVNLLVYCSSSRLIHKLCSLFSNLSLRYPAIILLHVVLVSSPLFSHRWVMATT